MAEINRRTGRPVTFGLAQSNAGPELYKVILDLVDEEAAAGGELRPQTTARGIGLLFGMQHRTFFDRAPSWQALQALDLAQRLAVLDDDAAARRADPRRRSEHCRRSTGTACTSSPTTGSTTRPIPPTSLAAHAQRARARRSPTAFVRISRETQRARAVQLPVPQPAHGRGRGDARTPAHARRSRRLRRARRADHGRVAPDVVPRALGPRPREVHDRGRHPPPHLRHRRPVRHRATAAGSRPARYADVNVIDLDALALPLPEYVHDFPARAGRYVQRSSGYRCTLVNGAVFVEDGEPQGVHAGVTLRSVPERA